MTSLSANALMTPVQLCLVRAGFARSLWGAALGYRQLVPGDNFYRRGPGFVFDFFRAGGRLPDLHGCERKRTNFGSYWKRSAPV